MAEILTESFCERCGTRYTFESPARRSNPFGALGTVGRGIRNFVASPDQTIDEAFAVARAESEMRQTAHQLEAFHQTFNFCLSCRQYTCGNCWNGVEGRCQSCAPMPEAEMLPASELATDSPVVAEAMAIAMAASAPVVEAPLAEPEPAWPEEPEPAVGPAAEAVAEPTEAIAEPAPMVESFAEAEPVDSTDAGLRFPPGVSLDDEIAAYELRVAALAPPTSDAAPVPNPAASVDPTAWPMAAERSAAVGDQAEGDFAEAAAPAPRIVRAEVPDVPAVSAVTQPASQSTGSCPSCGLALSATARFCRRCGTAQHPV